MQLCLPTTDAAILKKLKFRTGLIFGSTIWIFIAKLCKTRINTLKKFAETQVDHEKSDIGELIKS